MKTTERTFLIELALQTCIQYPHFVQEVLDMDDEYLIEFFNEVNDEANSQDEEFHKVFADRFKKTMEELDN